LGNYARRSEAEIELSPLILIAVFSIFIVLSLFLFLVLFLRPEEPIEAREPEIRDTIAGLSASNFHSFDMLFGNRDYRALRSKKELKAVSAKYRREHRRVALLWLGELQRDVRVVWEFRRFLVRNGLQVTFREEAAIACEACFAITYLNVASLSVFMFGPFALSGAVQSAKVPVEHLSKRGAGLLARAPATMRAQLQKRWNQHVVACDVG